MSMSQSDTIRLDDRALRALIDANLGLPFVILNNDDANESRLHKITCTYVRASMDPNSKTANKTGSHYLILESNAPSGATKNCNGKNCWNN